MQPIPSGRARYPFRLWTTRSFATRRLQVMSCFQSASLSSPAMTIGRRISSALSFVAFLVEIRLGVVMYLVLAFGGALLLSLICDKADAQVAREAFYSIPSETVSAADFLTGKKGT